MNPTTIYLLILGVVIIVICLCILASAVIYVIRDNNTTAVTLPIPTEPEQVFTNCTINQCSNSAEEGGEICTKSCYRTSDNKVVIIKGPKDMPSSAYASSAKTPICGKINAVCAANDYCMKSCVASADQTIIKRYEKGV